MRAYKSIFIIAIVSLGIPQMAKAQFQKKFTIDVGVSPLIPSQQALRSDRTPYLFSNFQFGYGLYSNLLYNISRKLSVGASINISTFRSWKDPRTEGGNDQSYFNIYNFAPNVKYKIVSKKISPFVIGGVGLSVYHSKRAQSTVLLRDFYSIDFTDQVNFVSIDQVLIREPGFEVKPKAAFSALAGFGIDVKISESIGITAMACYNVSFTSGNTTIDQNLNYLSFPIGVNLSIGKSKTL